MRKAAVNLCRMVLAVVFILSGYVKAIDPMGSQYKLSDYLEVTGLKAYIPDIATLVLSVAQAAVEFCLGILLLFAIQRRITSRLILLIMLIMTPLTLWLALTNPISDCGCFGEAIVLTNWQTFGKNVILLAAAVIVARWPMEMFRFVSKSNQWIVTNYTMLFILVTAGWSLYDRPIFDFRPYHIGANIKEGMEIPEGAEQPTFETTFILEKDGVQRSFGIDDYPDSTWTFVDSRTVQTKTGYVPPIHDFQITTLDGEDLTEQILNDTSYVFLLIAPHIEDADDSRLDLINELYEYARAHNYSFYGLTASNEKAINRWRDITGAEYTFCQADETMLKTIIRSNPGLLLLKDATVIQKWSHNALPELDEASMAQPLGKLEIGQMPEDTVLHKIVRILLWFVLPLMLLTIADRTWAWSKWVRRKRLIRLWGNKGIKMPKDKNDDFLTNKSNKHMRKKIVAGNWKMNMNLQDGIALAKELNETLKADKPNCGVVICTPFIHLASIAQFLDQDIIGLGAENCADKEKGAFTGEVSAEMVKSTGAQYVILGHSERREYYKETPEILKEKVLLAQKNDLKVIFCIGESLAEREAGKQNEVVKAELEGSVFNLSEEDFRKIVIAYEPIWAIGTGKTATAEQAEEIHAYIRSIIAEKYGQAVADDTTILYGGSCKASNAPELFAKPDIDGGLIGGASLKAADFKGIIDAWKK